MGKISKLRLSSPAPPGPPRTEEGVNREELAVLFAEQAGSNQQENAAPKAQTTTGLPALARNPGSE